MLLICLYVDDIIYIGSSFTIVNEFKPNMMHTFEMTDRKLLECVLGLEVKQFEGKVFVSQIKYAEDLLKMSDMQHCKRALNP